MNLKLPKVFDKLRLTLAGGHIEHFVKLSTGLSKYLRKLKFDNLNRSQLELIIPLSPDYFIVK